MIGYFPADLADHLGAPTTSLVYLAEFQFSDFTRRFWRGVGTLEAGGHTWQGFQDARQVSCVHISEIEHPSINIAIKTEITLSSVNRQFLADVRSDSGLIDGAKASVYALAINPGTYQPIGDPIEVFFGYCGAPTIKAKAGNPGIRSVSFSIDCIWSAKNFAPGGRLNDADQRTRYPDDRGLELVGSPAYERVK